MKILHTVIIITILLPYFLIHSIKCKENMLIRRTKFNKRKISGPLCYICGLNMVFFDNDYKCVNCDF